LDEALEDLDMGEGNKFLALRGSLRDAQGAVRKDIFKPRGDIHLNVAGTQIVSLRIRKMLEVMLPNLVPVQTPPAPAPALVQAPVQTTPAPVQTPAPAKTQRTRVQAPVSDPAPVAVNTSPVVGATLVAVVNAPAGVQQLVGQVQDLVIQHVAVIETPMEVEDEDLILQRLFFKRFGRALPEADEKEKESEVDKINFVIDLTDKDEMEVATSEAPVAVVKTEPIEVAVANVTDVAKRRSFRLERLELAKARKAINEFGKSLRKTDVIQEKEAPLAASNVIADTDSNMSEDASVNIESGNTTNADQIIAEIDAAIEASQRAIDEFDE
jgi:hypothetical protein